MRSGVIYLLHEKFSPFDSGDALRPNHSPSRLIVGVKGPRNFLPLTSALLLLLLRVTSREASSPASFSRTHTEWYIYCTQGFFLKKNHTPFPFPTFGGKTEEVWWVGGKAKKVGKVGGRGERRKLKSSFSFLLLLPPSPPPSPPSFLLPLF